MANKVIFNSEYPIITQSNELYSRSEGLIPAHTQTMAKGPSQYVNGISPKYIKRGRGSHVWDVDENEYIDYNMGIGPISLGYTYPKTDNAIIQQLKDGITFSMMHPLEVEVAEMLREIIPNAESVRYSKSGADVTSAAIRVARAYTGKNKILCCGYHGWHDWYVSTIARNAGIPQAIKDLTFTFNYNDIDSVRNSIDDDTAAIILEPVVFDEPKNNFLNELANLCKEKNILLIFDEMWTGFRMALGGAQEYFGITPDLATYSKAIANGMPLAVLTGKKEIMNLFDSDVFFFNTFGGEALSLAAAKATIEEMKEKDVIKYISTQGRILIEGIKKILYNSDIDFIEVKGYPFRSMLSFKETAGDPLLQKSFVQQELFKRGILWSGFHNISFSHTDMDIEYTLNVYNEVLLMLKDVVQNNELASSIKGIPVQPVFRKTSDFNTKPVMK
ncbi:MAG: aminotransferase class III-fold pyridoxal phosphate-dependent enzyme [Bacteroidota bacterium]